MRNPLRRRRPHKVVITYKTGVAVTLRVADFGVKRNLDAELISISWEDAKPTPLYAGIDNIESIYEV